MRLLSILLAFVLLLSGCNSRQASEVVPTYNPYVEAFTTGKISRFAPVYLILSQDLPEGADLTGKLKLTPEVEGTWTAENKRTLTFRPAQSFDYATTYRVDADLSDWFETDKDEARFAFSFSTYAFAIRGYQSGLDVSVANEDSLDIHYVLQTSDREMPERVEKLVSYPLGQAVWQHSPDGRRHELTLRDVPKKENGYTLDVTGKGEEAEDLSISLMIPAKGDFSVFDVRYVSEPERYVEITFTYSLDETQQLEGLAYLEGNTSKVVEVDGNKLRLFPDADRTGVVNVNLSRHIRSRGGLELGENVVRQLSLDKLGPSVRFIGNGVIVPGSSELTIPFQTVYLRGVTVRVIKVLEQNIGYFLQTNELDGSGDLMRVGRLVARKTIFFDDSENDLTRWKTYGINLRELVEPEPGAIYRVILSYNRDLSAYACPEIEQKSQAQIQAEDEVKFREDLKLFDEGGYYYYNNDYDWSDYKYQERNDPCSNSYYSNATVGRNVLASNLGLLAKAGEDGTMEVWVHDLITAKPLRGIQVKAYNYQNQELTSGKTDGEGQLTLSLKEDRPFYLIASDGKQRSYLRVDAGTSLSLSSFDVDGEVIQRGIKGFIYGERGVWRPGDTLHLSFMLNDRAGNWPEGHPVIMELYNPLGQLYQRQTQTQGILGLYTYHLPVAEDAPTGAWLAKVQAGGVMFEKRVRIESIKPNRLKIDVQWKDETLVRGKEARAELETAWLQGATARNLKYDIQGTFISTPTTFSSYENYGFDDPTKVFNSEESRLIAGTTDEKGKASVKARFDVGSSAPGMLLANFITKVYEPSGDFSVASSRKLYSPYTRYVGIHSGQQGDEALATGLDHRFDLLSVDSQGKPVGGTKLMVDIYKVDWYWWWSSDQSDLARFVSNSYNKPVKQMNLQTGSDGKVSFTLNYPDEEWGTYLIRATDKESKHTTGLLAYFDWTTSKGRRDASGANEATMLSFKTDKSEYKPGEELIVSFPSSEEARALISIENGVRVLQSFEQECEAGSTRVKIKVTPEMQPNAYLHITLLQPHGQTLNDNPIRMYGVVPFRVTSEESHLVPQISMAEELKPETDYTITISERSGRPMAYTLAIVDEGLLDLTNFATPDPWATFNAREALGVNTWDIYNYVVGAYSGRLEQLFSIGGDDALNKGPKAIVNRFAPVVQLEGPFLLEKGKSQKHTYRMPNYNGKVRVMVVAGDGSAYGNAEKSVFVKKPVMLLGTLPRVIGTGEEMLVPATVFATEDGVGEVSVSASCSSNMEIIGGASQTLSFTSKGDKLASFRIRVKDLPGKGTVHLVAKGKGETASYSAEIEIRSVRITQSSSRSFTVDAGQKWEQKIDLLGVSGTNRVSLEVSNVRQANLSARLAYLKGYPHGCIEQMVSKAFPQLYLSDFVEQTQEQEQQTEALIKETLSRMRSYQTVEGAFAYWPGSSGTHPWGTAYATHFLLEAQGCGYFLPNGLLENALSYLARTARNYQSPASNAPYVSEEPVQAYRLFVLALAQKAEVGAMNRLKEEKDLLPLSRCLLSAAYACIGRTDVAESMFTQTTDLSASSSRYADETFGSETRDKAIQLITCNLLKKDSEAASLADELAASLSSDEWLSTQSTSFALVALSQYMQQYPVGGELAFTCRTEGESSQNVHTAQHYWTTEWEPRGTSSSLALENTGQSPLFVRVVTEGIPAQGEERASAEGISLAVSYMTLDGKALDVSSLPQGTNFQVAVTLRNPSGRTLRNLVLSEVFPAGWEILNTRYLNASADSTAIGISYQDIRDDRVYSYIDVLPAGKQLTVKINACAVYPGQFYLPPVSCEAMYDRSIRANTEGRRVEVE